MSTYEEKFPFRIDPRTDYDKYIERALDALKHGGAGAEVAQVYATLALAEATRVSDRG